jgi:NADH-quinone oxidoreductase subunit M
MDISMATILNIVTYLPLVGAVILMMIPKEEERLIKSWALFISIITFILSISLFAHFKAGVADFQFVTKKIWIAAIGANYHVGIDGISLLLYMLTTFIMPLAIWASWDAIKNRIKEYMFAMLFLETGILGVFISLDLLLFYLFWEAMLIPMYLLIGVWGGPRRIYAAIKFVLYTLVGSLLMLVAILFIYFYHGSVTGVYTFDYVDIIHKISLPVNYQILLFFAFALAFAIKVPMWPLHTWLPDAHVEAPTAGSVILAGVLLKMGTYGFLRFNFSLFPEASVKYASVFIVLAVIGIIIGGMMSLIQKDVKKLVAYSSVAHLGFVMLGLFAFNIQGFKGGLIQMINHGVSTGGLFLAVGMIYERRHTRLIEDFGGITKTMPVFAVFFMIIVLSSLGLPGTNGFVGEFLILLGAFQASKIAGIIATTGIIVAAAYLLWMFKRVMFGPITKEENKKLIDLNAREIGILLPIILFIFWIGVNSEFFLKKTNASLEASLTKMQKVKQEMVLKKEKSTKMNIQIVDKDHSEQGSH